MLGLLHGAPVREALATGVAVAVAAVPEGLPLVATVAQSAAARRLSHRGVLTRSPRVLEALGRVDTVCFDKTGTLTEGRLSVARVAAYDHDLPIDGPLGHRLLRTAARACPGARGRPGAGPRHRPGRGRTRRPRTATGTTPGGRCPSCSSRPAAASRRVWARSPGGRGSPSRGRPRSCSTGAPPPWARAADGPVPLTAERLRSTERLLYSLASDGLRVLAVAESLPDTAEAPARPTRRGRRWPSWRAG